MFFDHVLYITICYTMNSILLYANALRRKEKEMLTLGFVLFVVFLVALDVAALRWGVDSTDGINSPEWERRQWWYGFH